MTATLCILRAVLIHVNHEVYDPGKKVVREDKLRPVSRLGGDTCVQLQPGPFWRRRPGLAQR